MNDVSMTTAAEPDGAPRIAVLDILRGVAILGILFMNINDMGQSLWASFDDIRHLGWNTTDRIAWVLREVLADGTARCLLEMLFGAGMVILTNRAAGAAGFWKVMGRYYMRNLILFAFGLVHVFILLWPGDILHTYGLAALVAFLFSRLEARWLIMVGLTLTVFTLVWGGFGIYSESQRIETVAVARAKQQSQQPLTTVERKALVETKKSDAKHAESLAKLNKRVAEEDKARNGTFMTWASAQWGVTWFLESRGLEILFIWEAAATMLIGAGLFKLGVLQGQRSARFYAILTGVAYAIGTTLRGIEAWQTMQFTDTPQLNWATQEFARLAMTLGHIGAINLLVTTMVGARLLKPFVAAGRTALTIYICQTIITLWVLFPPFALHLYGKLTWGPLMVTAFVINAFLLWAANLYVRHFDIAPVEWAWRSLVEWRVLPWRKRSRPLGSTGTIPVAV